MKYTPSLEEVKELASQGNVAPVYREVPADLETPVSAFLKVARGKHSFLLESVEGGENFGRYSFIGTEPYRVLRTGSGDGDPLVEIENELSRFQLVPVPGLPRFHGGAVGYMSYEVARYYERLPMPETDPQGFPESVFLFTDTMLVFDHVQHNIKVVSHARLDGDIEASYRQAVWKIDELVARLAQPLTALPYRSDDAASPQPNGAAESNNTREEFMAKVERAKEYIVRGDTYQIQVSQRFTRRTGAHPFEVYRALRMVNPSPYMFYLELDDMHVVGASPEMLIRVEDGLIETHPIAGTRRRGRDAEDEERMARELQSSEKERAEHIMLVDLARNDLGRVSEPGSVEVTSLMAIERYSHVMHMVSHVVGKLRKDLTTYDAMRAYFPHGTVTGAPKIRTMEIIAELEGERRGGYGGCVAYFDLSGNCDTALAIRTIWMKPGVAYVQAAGGVVYDSTPEEEYLESHNKARAMLRAIELAEETAQTAPRGSLGY